jgi:dTDP-4-dehydrorhamnose reductase
MIIGHGDIASILKDREDRIYFASGVSNSAETNFSEFAREKLLLLNQEREKRLVYFSSLCVFYSKNRYAIHKRAMELLVKKYFPLYTIIRLGNIDWGDNPYTLINFMKNTINQGNKTYDVQDVYRHIVDKEEFLHWINMIPDWNCEINIPGKLIKVYDLSVNLAKEYIYGWQQERIEHTHPSAQ